MVRGRRRSLLAALLGPLALSVGVAACGGSHKSVTTPSIASHTRTHSSGTASTGTTSITTSGTATSPTGGDTTTVGPGTTTSSATGTGSGPGSGGSSGGAGLGGGTTSTTTTTTTTTSSSCTGRDCQDGSPTVPGSVSPVNGKCRSGYVYVAAQDGGPALCIPLQTTTTPSTATQ